MESHVVRACCMLALVACGGGAPKETRAPKLEHVIEWREASDRLLTFKLVTVKRETPPPGWKQAPFMMEEARGSSSSLVHKATERVVTAAVVDGENRPYGTIEHLDDSETFYAVAENDRTLRVYVPIVGPAGEALTQIYRVHPRDSPPDIAPIGKPLPRIARWYHLRDKDKPAFVFTLPVPGSKDFVQLVDEKGDRIPFPAGVVGLVPVTRFPAGPLQGNDWGGWLVRFEGAKGEGWSLHTEPTLAGFDASGPRWTKPVERLDKLPKVQAIGGIRDDGACEVTLTHVQAEARIPKSIDHRVGVTCEEAAKEISADVVAIEEKRMAAEKVVADREKAERDAKDKLALLLQKKRKEREAEDAKREAREQPIIAKWKEELAGGHRDKACALAKTLGPATHARLYVQQTMADQGVGDEDHGCVTSRNDLSAEDKRAVESAARRLYAERAERPTTQAPIGQGKLQDLGSKEPTAAERLKQTNDYTYGSGRGSSCPYTDRSLCH